MPQFLFVHIPEQRLFFNCLFALLFALDNGDLYVGFLTPNFVVLSPTMLYIE